MTTLAIIAAAVLGVGVGALGMALACAAGRADRALRDDPAWHVEGPRDVLDDGPWGPA